MKKRNCISIYYASVALFSVDLPW